MKLIQTTAQAFKEKYPDDYVDGANLQYFDTDIGMGIIKDVQLGQISVTKIPKENEKLFDEQVLLLSLANTFSQSLNNNPTFDDIGGFDGDDREIYESPFDYRLENVKKRKKLNKLRLQELVWNILTEGMLLVLIVYIIYIAYNVIKNGGV